MVINYDAVFPHRLRRLGLIQQPGACQDSCCAFYVFNLDIVHLLTHIETEMYMYTFSLHSPIRYPLLSRSVLILTSWKSNTRTAHPSPVGDEVAFHPRIGHGRTMMAAVYSSSAAEVRLRSRRRRGRGFRRLPECAESLGLWSSPPGDAFP
jgi:hypothetical protein